MAIGRCRLAPVDVPWAFFPLPCVLPCDAKTLMVTPEVGPLTPVTVPVIEPVAGAAVSPRASVPPRHNNDMHERAITNCFIRRDISISLQESMLSPSPRCDATTI